MVRIGILRPASRARGEVPRVGGNFLTGFVACDNPDCGRVFGGTVAHIGKPCHVCAHAAKPDAVRAAEDAAHDAIARANGY